jgi:predicted transcriptional regulator
MILLFLFEECKKSRSHVTEPLTIIHIASALEIATGSIKTSIARLCEKAVLKISSYKNGRGGWSVYEIPEIVYKELLQMETQHKLHTNQTQSRHKVDTKLNTQLNTNASSSSSSLDLKETTTTELADEWNFDIASYARFGFTATQLKQVASLGNISATDVEQSLIEFSYDLDNNALPPIKTNKINFLMGLLRAGHSYVSEGFKNEQDAMIAEMARRAEDKRKNLLEAKFAAWEAALNDEERKEIVNKLPTHLTVLHRTYGVSNVEVRSWLFNYYLQVKSQ